MKVKVDRERCISSGQCNMIAPEVFSQDELAKVTLLTDQPPADQESDVAEAARICPSQAITVETD